MKIRTRLAILAGSATSAIAVGSLAAALGLAFAPPAQAISLELAKTCTTLMNKAYPPRIPGNPAAGRTKGTPKEVNAYWKDCLAKNGKVDDPEPAQKPATGGTKR